MEISKSISFITEDPRWQQKLMIGTGVIIASTILSAVLIGFIGGTTLAVVKAVAVADGDAVLAASLGDYSSFLASSWIMARILAKSSGGGSAVPRSRMTDLSLVSNS